MVRRTILTICSYVLLLGASVSLTAAQPAQRTVPLSVEEVVRLTKSGVSENVIITEIKRNGKPFDLNADEILVLKKSGVSDTVINYLLDPSQPYTPPPPPKPAEAPAPPKAPPKKYPEDANASKVPPDPGLYSFPNGSLVQSDIKILLGEGSGASKLLKKKGKATAYLVGPAAKTRVPEGNPVFYIRLPQGTGIEEVLLVALERKNDRREFEVGEIKPEVLRQFDPLEVGPSLYRLTPAKLNPGEYLFYLNGSAEPAKGNFGKGYDFGTGTVPEGKH
jgi:hypothetical protein